MKRSLFTVLFPLVLAAFATGCAGTPSVDAVRWEIERRIPEARFELEEHVRLGRISMGLLHGLVRMVPGTVEGQEIVTSIHRIEMATYRVGSLPDLDRLEERTHFERDLARAGWSTLVRTREEDSRTWLFVHTTPGGGFSNLFVVSLEDDELTLVRLDGRLDRAFAEAMADHPKEMMQQVGAGS